MSKINLITLGESGVGKTSLLNTFRFGKFKASRNNTFIDHFSSTITVENIKTDVVIWDTAGQEKFNSLIKRYYAMADGVLLVYDVCDTLTFSKLSKWLSDLRSENENAEVIIVGNKNEDPTTKLVSSVDVQNFAESKKLQNIEASAKTGENVDLVFQTLMKNILLAKGMLQTPENQRKPEDNINLRNTSKSRNVKKEPEIKLTHRKKSRSDRATLNGANAEEPSEENKSSKSCC